LVTWVGLDQSKNEQLFAFSHHENGIAGFKDFHDPLPVDGVYRCLGVFRGVVNTVEFCNHSDLFQFDAPSGDVLGRLVEKEGWEKI